MTDLLSKINTLIRARVEGFLSEDLGLSLGRQDRSPLSADRLGKGIDREIAELRKRIDEALDREEKLQAEVAALRQEAADWDVRADNALLQNDEGTARHAVTQMKRAEQRAALLEADLSGLRYAAAELIDRVNVLEGLVADARRQQAAPPPPPPVSAPIAEPSAAVPQQPPASRLAAPPPAKPAPEPPVTIKVKVNQPAAVTPEPPPPAKAAPQKPPTVKVPVTQPAKSAPEPQSAKPEAAPPPATRTLEQPPAASTQQPQTVSFAPATQPNATLDDVLQTARREIENLEAEEKRVAQAQEQARQVAEEIRVADDLAARRARLAKREIPKSGESSVEK